MTPRFFIDRPVFAWVIALVGAGIGALSRSNHGRNFCLVVFVLACLRLMLGGGII